MDNLDDTGLADRVCVVTGAASGIGRAIALALARAQGRVAVVDCDAAGAAATVAAIGAAGGEGVAVDCDVALAASVDAAAERVAARLGPCGVLVNCAAIKRGGALATLAPADWSALIAVNLTAYFLCAQAFGRQMRAARRGAIVHIASIAGHHATAAGGAYSVAKAGVLMLSRQLALEWAADGIRSNAVSPGMIVTPFSQANYADPALAARRAAAIPLGRIGVPEEVAEAVVFLASDRARYITGDELSVDGGFSQMLMGSVPRPAYS